MSGRIGTLGAALLAFAALALLGRVLPHWFVLVATLAFAKGLVALGLVVLMRGGLVSFGQGIFFCAGGYAAGLAMRIRRRPTRSCWLRWAAPLPSSSGSSSRRSWPDTVASSSPH